MSLLETSLPGFGLGNWRQCARRENILFCFGERALARRAACELFGEAIDGRHYAGLAGAPDGAEVEVGLCGGRLTVEISDPCQRLYSGMSRVYRAAEGPVIIIESLHIHRPSMRGRGLGRAIFARQLRTARMLGVVRIETRAGRGPGENGYYTWPRYGFDGRLPQWLASSLPDEIRTADNILAIMATLAGRQWWLRHGITLDVAFEVARSSRCSRTFQRYLRASKAEQFGQRAQQHYCTNHGCPDGGK